MKFVRSLLLVAAASAVPLVGAGCCPAHLRHKAVLPMESPYQPPPASRRDDIVEDRFGTQVADPYRWLEDEKSAETQAWVTAQDNHANAYLQASPGREALEKRFTELFYVDAVTPPYRRGDRVFYTRRTKDREKAVIHWKSVGDETEQVLLDPNVLSPDGSIAIGGWFPTWDGRLVAYKLKANNADEADMLVRDVARGVDLPDRLVGAKYAGAAWTPDNSGFYYVHLPSGPDIAVADRPGFAEVRWHQLGTPQASDPLVFPRIGDARTFIDTSLSRDGRFLFVTAQYGWNANDVYFKDLTKGQAVVDTGHTVAGGNTEGDTKARIRAEALARGFTPLASGKDAVTFVSAHEGVFYVLTNDGAPNYRVFRVDPEKPEEAAWQVIVPEGDGPIEDLVKVGPGFIVHRLSRAQSRLELWTTTGERKSDLPLPGIGSVTSIVGHPDDARIYFTFTSFVEPPSTFSTDLDTMKTDVWFRLDVPVDTKQFVAEQVTYTSRDGTPVTMFLVHRKGLVRDGSHPTLLYGYGGFNVNMTPAFSGAVATWVEMGGVYAMPNLRGGGEYGESWHRAGMLDKKQNVFDDFHAAAEWLISNGYTRPERLAIRGGSNGGLLVGVAMTQRPDLYRAVICAVPLLDMVRYHLFGSGMTWIPEYGSADNASDFAFIHAYSPYHHVERGTTYPALLMLGADSDDRVDPMHARKFTALVQWANEGNAAARNAIFRLERNAGHGGGDMVKKNIENYMDQWSFLARELRMDLTDFIARHVGEAGREGAK
jgi:prolyl oligopeptidase